jgi:transcriptional regulator with XRE-family HTH domain/Zn-dependent peptidase ImmA (M78 family)
MSFCESFGAYARQLRVVRGLGLRQVARQLGISAAYLSRVENDIEPPSGELIALMAGLYGVPVEEFTKRPTKRKVSAAAHGHTIQSSPELRALYRLGVRYDSEEIWDFIRKLLRDKGVPEREIESQLNSLRGELPRVSRASRDALFAAGARPRFLTKQRISQMAEALLERNGITRGTYEPPTPIEQLVESEPGVSYRIEALKCDTRGSALVLGLTRWGENGDRQIVVNSVLADSHRESDEHRFNFTLGHELFHAIEHLPRAKRETAAPLARTQVFLEMDYPKPRSAAERSVDRWVNEKTSARRLDTHEDWREWQANLFSASLLMPDWSVIAKFEERMGTQRLAAHSVHEARQLALHLAGEREFELGYFETGLAEEFAVSRHAMAIRLMQLGLVKEDSEK